MQTSRGYVPDCLVKGPSVGRRYWIDVNDRRVRVVVTEIDGDRARITVLRGPTLTVRVSDLVAAEAEEWGLSIARSEDDED